MRRRPLIATIPALVALALLAALTAITPQGRELWSEATSRLGWTTPEEDWKRTPQDPVYYTDVDDSAGLTEEEIRQIAYDVCPQALDLGNCLDYTVGITSLDGAFGLVEVSWTRNEDGSARDEAPLTADKVLLDRSLTEKPAQYVANVAAHEWNHIEQVLRVKTAGERRALKARAFEYYTTRVPGGLGRKDLGLEILTDCMATQGDNVPAGDERNVIPHYIKTYMGATDTAEACGDWQAVLHGVGE